MRVGLVIYGDLETVSGGYLYDRMLVASLRACGDEVEIISLPWRNYARHLADNFSLALRDRLREGAWDVLLQDELNHPSLFLLNARLGVPRPWPVVAIVHHLRSSEMRPAWQNWFYRWVERRYLDSVDGFIFNSTTTQAVVARLVGRVPFGVVAPPGRDHRLPDGRRTLVRGSLPGQAPASDADGRRTLVPDSLLGQAPASDADGRRTLVRDSLPGQAPASGQDGRRTLVRDFLPGQAPASGQDGRRTLVRDSLPGQAPASGQDGRRTLVRDSLPGQAPASDQDGRRTLVRDSLPGQAPASDQDGRRTLVRDSLPGQAPASGQDGRRTLVRDSLPGQAPASDQDGRRTLVRDSLPGQAPASDQDGRRTLVPDSLPGQAPASGQDGRRTLVRDSLPGQAPASGQDGRRTLVRDSLPGQAPASDDDGRRTLVRDSLPGQAPASGQDGRRTLVRDSLPGQAPASGQDGRRTLVRDSLPGQAPASGQDGRRTLVRDSLPGQAPASEVAAQVIQRAFAAGPLRVLFVGNLIPRKGLHTVLDALAQLPAEACRLTVVGSDRADPRYAALIRDRIARLGLVGRVELIGPLPDDVLNQLLAQSHVLAVPSSYEGYGIVYAEALGYGLPVIASAAGAAHEIITDGREGYLIAPEDAAAVAAILRRLSSDRAQLAAMAQAALERFATLPTWAESTARARGFLSSMVR